MQRLDNPMVMLYNVTTNRRADMLGKIEDVKIINMKAVTSNIVVRGKLDGSNIWLYRLFPKEGGKAYDISVPRNAPHQEYKGYVIN